MSRYEVEQYGPEYQVLDADGGLIAPGFVDIHSGYIGPSYRRGRLR
jgi:alpha-D-ribose 1-methylphosphonate 5-triphosphate diphosphatase